MNTEASEDFFGATRISRILFKIAPPVMLALLIQALYNLVDSFFIGQYADEALTALSVIFPIQLIIVALAVGTGVGVNTYMAQKYAQNRQKDAHATAGTGMLLAIFSWAALALIAVLIMRPYVTASSSSPLAIEYGVIYGNIVCVGSLGTFLESCWTKVHQARGNMRLPMLAQIAGAVVNTVLDPILIFGLGPIPAMGVAGAAIATIIGQTIAALIVARGGICRPPKPTTMWHYIKRIYRRRYSAHLYETK